MNEIIQTLLLLAGIVFLGVIACILGDILDELKEIQKNDEAYTPLPYPTREEIEDAIDNRLQ